jgi:hypothetical protein
MRVSPNCWASLPYTDAHSRWIRNAPRLVAEALQPVELPLATALRAGPRAPAALVARAIARALAPVEADAPTPPWLRPGQDVSFRRALASVRRHGGALLADPVGSGKTYVALAVGAAIAENGPEADVVTCLVPAALRSQWQEALRRTGVTGVVHSHELASRGRLPSTTGPVVIDESHRFRNPGTTRYARVADWLLGRPLLLASATPVVNRPADLARQLQLGVRDDTLAACGLPSLAALGPEGHPALGALVTARSDVTGLPAEVQRRVVPGDSPATGVLLAGLDRLRLSSDPGVASLVRAGLLRALASSPAAFAGALIRYRALLLQAGDANEAGRVAGRSTLRALSGGDATQLVMWALLPPEAADWELALDDADPLADLAEAARAAAGPKAFDPRLDEVVRLLGDGRPTLVFTAFRDTALALRARLSRAAWITGDRAGLGPMRTGRAAALAPFRRDGGPVGREPRVLLATDVAAEGLDLRGVSRVVHFDLPWTDVRLVQRAGRARRLGAQHRSVDVVTLATAPGLERRLRLTEVLGRKRSLAERLVNSPPWRWVAALAELGSTATGAVEGVAVVPTSGAAGVLAGLRVEEVGDGAQPVAAWVGWRADRDHRGGWSAARDVVAPRLAALLEPPSARGLLAGPPLDPQTLARIVRDLAGEASRLLRQASAARLGGVARTAGAAALRRRLLAEAAEARRARDPTRIAALDAWLAFLSRGHTAGEARLIARLAGVPGLAATLACPPPRDPSASGTGPGGALRVRLTGVVVFRAGGC